jgi:carboxypeptidase family protein
VRTKPTVLRLFVTAAVHIAAIGFGAPVGAQTGGESVLVAGIADAESGRAVEGAEVILTRPSRVARSNALGEAIIPGVVRGTQRIRVRRLGYAPIEVDLAIAGDTTGAVFRLRRAVTTLGTVAVEAGWIPARMKDVANRRKQGIGRFLDDADLERDQGRDFALVAATRFPGLTTMAGDGNHRTLVSTRGLCPVTIYLDGSAIFQPKLGVQSVGNDADVIRTWDVAVVEFYTGAQVPVQYRAHGYGCGVLLLWSKWY